MAKIFISYKFKDESVPQQIIHQLSGKKTTVRNFVDHIQSKLDVNDHINKGEDDGEDLSHFKDETIASRLRDKIYDSTVTIVLISKNMVNPYIPEEDQWIPWEISYSLKESTRNDRTSRSNSLIAVVLPDENNSYDYFITENNCQSCQVSIWLTHKTFSIIKKNMFNKKYPDTKVCEDSSCMQLHHTGLDHSYIHPVKWDTFVENINGYINIADTIKSNINYYDIQKNL